ncbi:hypothetical protein HYC85_015042 [Camellia sinensis]|uniref:Terpene synthase metal-binding domain-containing protein n=1 Tax=Camellia sinensis TaxID=4442 RepID=A0A7J7H917_CAMSI|nr:hypothetical protein HYC85_015042 [Camellia sinensis]
MNEWAKGRFDMNEWAKGRFDMNEWAKGRFDMNEWAKGRFDMNEWAKGRFDMNEWAKGRFDMNEWAKGRFDMNEWAKGRFDMNEWAKGRFDMIEWAKGRFDMNEWAKGRFDMNEWAKGRFDMNEWAKGRFDMNEWAKGRFDMNEWAKGRFDMNEWAKGRFDMNKWAKGLRLRQLYNTYETDYDHHDDKAKDDLYTIALLFRLLRQQGYPISCVKHSHTSPYVSLATLIYHVLDGLRRCVQQIQGRQWQNSRILNWRCERNEAAHLRVRGEDILDEALSFTITHLESAVSNLSNLVQEQVIHALNQPIHKGLTRLEATRYFFFYEQDDSHNKVLLNFAKLDFNLLQKMHQWELSEITRWWKELDFAKKMPFARDRMVECYFWILGVYFEPQYLLARRMLTKVTALTSIIDDIYDVYGTLEELVLFTDAIERWEISAIDQLPEYMKPCYQALLDVYNMIDEEMARKETSYRVHYAKSAMKILVRAYFEEAKWFHQGYVPSIEEYMRVALVTSCYTMLTTSSLMGMGEVVSKEAFDWVSSGPLIVQASSVVCRLMDDIVSRKVIR